MVTVMSNSAPRRARRPRKETARHREDILRAAMTTFGNRGYTNGSLAEIADQVGMTHAGVLHHFGSKGRLLLEMLEFRDRTDVEHLEGQHIPGGLDLFRHLVLTARLNAERPVMDGLQVQWLLDPGAVDLAHASAFAIEAILAAAVAGRKQPSLL
jgi:AcrR family transcriptional regulator